MSSTITVQDLINFARTHVKLAPLDGLGGFAKEPALTIANKVKKRIIRKPFNWEWNRATILPFTTRDGVDEYIVAADDIAWLEGAEREDHESTASPKPREIVEVRRNLRNADYKGDPQLVALDRNVFGSTIVRIVPVPGSKSYKFYIHYQRKSEKLTELTDTFDPIPDDMQDVLEQFFLAFCYRLVDKQQYFQELAEAERLLMEERAYQSQEEQGVLFIPDPIFLG